MGLHISIQKPLGAGNQHPRWDDLRYAGDREAAKLIISLPLIETNPCSPPDYEPHYRPSDFAAWRAAPWPQENPERYQKMIDILEADEEYWIYLSY